MDQPDIDNLPCAVILTAISEEFRAVRSFLSSVSRVKHPHGTVYQQGIFADNGRTWRVVVCEIGAGNSGAALEAERASAHFHPQVLAFVGVAGGLKDVRIGDVVAATKIYGYEAGKAKEEFQTRPEVFHSSYELEQEARAVANEDAWIGRLKSQPESLPCAIVGPIAAGEKVIASTYSDAWGLIKKHYGDALAVEMEGVGFLKAGHANQHVRTLVVRGISDMVDKKEEADATGSQEVAAERASAFLFELLANLDSQPNTPQRVTAPTVTATVFNIPEENSFFTGRTDVLDALSSLLHQGQRVALYGMSGIGKTQIAEYYANKHRSEYTHVFLVSADTIPAIMSGYTSIAEHILPELGQETDQNKIVEVVKMWLSNHSDWLLVLDDVNDLNEISGYVPVSKSGHIIFTTTQSAFGNVAQGVEVTDLTPEIGATLLLRRAKIIAVSAGLDTATQEDQNAALALSVEMQGLPLALDQAGAYIEDVGRTPTQYLDLYQRRDTDLLAERGNNPTGHSLPVAVTFSLAISKLEQKNPASAELLRVCSCLAPFAIPEELFILSAEVWSDNLSSAASDEIEWGKAIQAAKNLSLIRINVEDNTISFHQLVHLLLGNELTDEEQCLTVERHVMALHNALKHYEELSSQKLVKEGYGYERFKLQIGWVGLFVEAYKIYTIEAVNIYFNTGLYLLSSGVYNFAKDLLSFTLEMFISISGPKHPQLAELFNRLGMCCYYLNQSDEAEALYNQAIEIAEAELGGSHESVGIYYDNLVGVYVSQKRYAEAAQATGKAAAIIEERLGAGHDDMAINLSNQAWMSAQNGDDMQAEKTWLASIKVLQNNHGHDNYQLALPMQNLAMFYQQRERDEEAKTLILKSLAIMEAEFGSTSARLIGVLNNLGSICIAQNYEEEAVTHLTRAVDIVRQSFGSNPSEYARALNNLGVMFDRLRKHDEAQPILEESLAIREVTFGKEHPETATGCKNLGVNYFFQNRHAEAEDLYQKALAIREKEYGFDSPFVDMVLTDYINLLSSLDRPNEAEEMRQRSEEIRAKWDEGPMPV